MIERSVVLAFDLYGTLLSTSSISTTLSGVLGVSSDKGDVLASRWRTLQLEYSWRITCMRKYVSFRELAQASLLHALAEEKIPTPGDETLVRLMDAFDGLPAFSDAVKGLEVLAAKKAKTSSGINIKAVVFSNGAEAMVKQAVVKANLEGSGMVFDGVVSIEPMRAFKPSPQVYQHLVESTGGQDGEVWLISSNPFDVVGVLGLDIPGLKAAWVDRAGTGWTDQLGGVIGVEKPSLVVRGVDEAMRVILSGMA